MKHLFALIALAFGVFGCVTLAPAEPIHFSLTDMQPAGGMYDSAGQAGKPIVIEFYFESCPYCNQNAGNVKSLAAEWHGEKAQVIEVGVDCDRSDYDKWIRRHAPIVPVLKDCDGDSLAQRLGVSSYPTTIVLDKNHNRVYATAGVWSAAKKQKIRLLLQENTSQMGD